MSERLDELLSGVRFGRFVSVGAVGAVVDNLTLLALASGAGVYRGAAKLAGAELAIVVMFLINERWTFAEEGAVGRRPAVRRFLRSNLVRAGGVLVATAVFVVVSGLAPPVPWLPEPVWLTVANGCGILVGLVVNYVAESLFTWRVGTRDGDD
jgi:putative flippase GtrA